MIVVFGSINIDLVTHVEHIAAPGETVLGQSYSRIPGGKGANQALAARRAGAKVALVGATGLDGFADTALSLLLAEGVDLTGVAHLDQPTGAAFIAVDASGQNAITVAAGANGQARGAQLDSVPVHESDILLLQREVPDQESARAAAIAKGRGCRIVLNLAPAGRIADDFLESIDVLVLNEHEAAYLAREFGLGADHTSLAKHLAERYGTATVVTLGAEGAVGWFEGAEHRAASPKIEAVDTTAAGDTFVGAFAAALDAGLPFGTALRRGTVAGSLACTRHGAQPSIPTGAEIDAVMAGR